jgi:hypothetical protein
MQAFGNALKEKPSLYRAIRIIEITDLFTLVFLIAVIAISTSATSGVCKGMSMKLEPLIPAIDAFSDSDEWVRDPYQLCSQSDACTIQ